MVDLLEKKAERISNRLYYELKKFHYCSFLPLPDMGHSIYYCGYIYAPYKIIKKIANKLNDIIEITYPAYGLSGIEEEREKIYKVGFDTAHWRCDGTTEEAKTFINEWIKIAIEANEQANV